MPRNPFSNSSKSLNIDIQSKSSFNDNFIKNLQGLKFEEVGEEEEKDNPPKYELEPNFGFVDKPPIYTPKPQNKPKIDLNLSATVIEKAKMKSELRELEEEIENERKEIIMLKTLRSRSVSRTSNQSRKPRISPENPPIEIRTCKSQKTIRASPFRKQRTRSFNIEREPIKVEKLDQKKKERIVEWLYESNLLKRKISNPEERLYEICKEGVIFFDIINAAEGRGKEAIRGAHRTPKNISHVKANYKRVMDFLRSKEKFNSRLLFAEEEIINGNEDAFWGLLEDIYAFYNGKNHWSSSKSGIKKCYSIGRITPLKISDEIRNMDEMERKSGREQCPKPQKIPKKLFSNSNERSAHKGIQTSDFVNRDNSKAIPPSNGYSAKKLKAQITPKHTPSKSTSRKMFRVPNESKNHIDKWIKEIGLEFFLQTKDRILYEDMFRNGILLCEVIKRELKVDQQNFKKMKYAPRNIQQCRNNLTVCLDFLREKLGDHLNSELFFAEEKILEGDYDIVYGLLKSIRELIIENSPFKASAIREDGYLLPYSQKETLNLTSLLNSYLQTVFERKEDILETWTYQNILEKLIQKKVNPKFKIYYSKPLNSKQKLANIRQCLTIFRNMKNFGQKFLWNEADILAEDKQIFLGFLEDFYRWQKNYPARQGVNYFIDGPVLEEFENEELSIPKSLTYLSSLKIQMPQINIDNDKENDYELNTQVKKEINEWVSSFSLPKFDWRKSSQVNFKDGTLLASILEKALKSKIPGIIYSKSMNIAFSNFRKCFTFCRKNNILTNSHLKHYREKELYEASNDIILALLSDIKRGIINSKY